MNDYSAAQTSKPKKAARLYELDAMRGLAAMAVVLYHYCTRYDELIGHSTDLFYGFVWGCRGVQIFFVLSGFVIYMSLDRSAKTQDFLASRFARLYPTYWAGLFVTTLVVSWRGLPFWNLSWSQIGVNVSMLQGFLLVPSVDGAYWSLTEELKFYFLMMLFVFAGQIKRPFRIAVIWLTASAVAVLAMKHVGGDLAKFSFIILSAKHSHWFVDGIAFYGIHRDRTNLWNYFLLVISVVHSVCIIQTSFSYFRLHVTIIALFAAVVFAGLKPLRWKPLLFLGGISYPLYVVHQNVGYCVINYAYSVGASGYVGVAAAILISVALATLIHYFVEIPVGRAIRDRYASWKTERAVRMGMTVSN